MDPVVGDVEPNSTGSGGEYVGNRITPPTATTRSGRVSRLPRILRIILVRGATRAKNQIDFKNQAKIKSILKSRLGF